MLPSELLRFKIIRNELILPSFVEINDENLFLADSLIEIYNSCVGKKLKDLDKMIKEEERRAEELGYDFKFFRGLKALLDRRLILDEKESDVDAIRIRASLFETCNEILGGFALNDEERSKLIKLVSERLRLDESKVIEAFYSIYEEERIIKDFLKISGEELLRLYNLSLLQTLLFKCRKLYLDVQVSGLEMKKLLFNIKKLGLLYLAEKSYLGVNLAIDGPTSILKQSERYGTRMAKLIPLLLSFKRWKMRAYIARKLKLRRYKIYRLELSKEASENLLPKKVDEKINFDSYVEEDFSIKFFSIGGEWQLIREPEPLVLDGFIFIPDFALVKGDKKIYLEIMGFWSPEYINKKLEKIKKIKDIKLILAIDSSLGDIKIDHPNIYVIKYKKNLSAVDVIKLLNKIDSISS